MGSHLSGENKQQLWIPPGFTHGFLTLSATAEFFYKITDFYAPQTERCIAWNDPAIGVQWRYDDQPLLSGKDQLGLALQAAEVFD